MKRMVYVHYPMADGKTEKVIPYEFATALEARAFIMGFSAAGVSKVEGAWVSDPKEV